MPIAMGGERSRKLKIVVSYHGGAFHGWQRQKGDRTVQEVLETALARILGHRVKILGSGRTDAGVHALGQVAAFETTSNIPLAGLVKGVNSMLPGDVAVLSAQEVEPEFHPIASATGKRYCYTLLRSEQPIPLLADRSWRIGHRLDLQAMREAGRLLLGTHDFSSFMGAGSSVSSTVRTLTRLDIDQRSLTEYEIGAEIVKITLEANGFLKYMVRNITGLLVEVGLGRREAHEAKHVLEARDRRIAGPTAPPQGLCLMKVFYTQRP